MDLGKLRTAQAEQNHELIAMQERLARAYGLEDTVKRQEVVIEKLEQMIREMARQKKIFSMYH